METATTVSVAAAVLASALVIALIVQLGRQRRSHERDLAELRSTAEAETAALHRRLEELAAGQEQLRRRATSAGLLITDVDEPRPEVVSDRAVVTATLGVPLIKVAATAHGLRRAFSAENRNRIRFEMRREVRRARKQRKREMRAAWREQRTGSERAA